MLLSPPDIIKLLNLGQSDRWKIMPHFNLNIFSLWLKMSIFISHWYFFIYTLPVHAPFPFCIVCYSLYCYWFVWSLLLRKVVIFSFVLCKYMFLVCCLCFHFMYIFLWCNSFKCYVVKGSNHSFLLYFEFCILFRKGFFT